ncbi:MAG TPA: hypothetical protein VJ779_22920 [Acetobacteraceae bacterium]|nr:hypothetical protein [Acetobacteraceae bacterium]
MIEAVVNGGLVPAGGCLLMALFVPMLCLIAVRLKSSRKQAKLNSAISLYNLQEDHYYKVYQSRQPPSRSQSCFPIVVISLLNVYFSMIMIYTPPVLAPPEFLSNFFLLGSRYGVPYDPDIARYMLQTFDVICFSYLGWYVWTVSTIFSRIMTMELVAATYYSILTRLVISVCVAVALRHMQSALGLLDAGEAAHPHFTAEAVGFGIGLFPLAALTVITRQLRRMLLGDAGRAEELSLELIQGISPFRNLRLYEVGLDNCENLAAANAVSLFLSSNLSLPEVIDWIGQAQLLVLVGPENFATLQKNGYRTSIDFQRACGSCARSRLAELLGYTDAQLLDLQDGLKTDPNFERLTQLRERLRSAQGRSRQPARTGPQPAAPSKDAAIRQRAPALDRRLAQEALEPVA